jgi:hypothetical protein
LQREIIFACEPGLIHNVAVSRHRFGAIHSSSNVPAPSYCEPLAIKEAST